MAIEKPRSVAPAANVRKPLSLPSVPSVADLDVLRGIAVLHGLLTDCRTLRIALPSSEGPVDVDDRLVAHVEGAHAELLETGAAAVH